MLFQVGTLFSRFSSRSRAKNENKRECCFLLRAAVRSVCDGAEAQHVMQPPY